MLAGGDLPGASAVYREAVGRFPNNAVVRTGLAEVLKVQGKLAEAEAEYREAKTRFSGSSLSSDNLTADPKAEDREKNIVATDSSELPVSPTDHERIDAAPRGVPVEPGLGRREIKIIANDAFLVRRWARTTRAYSLDLASGHFRDHAEDLLKRLLPAIDRDSITAGEAALLELDRGELEQALALLRRAVERFPGSARVRYALARAEREASQGDPITSWRRLLRLDEHYKPIFFLGVGRIYLNRANDDGGAEHKARDKLGRLAFWIHQHTLTDADHAPTDPPADPRSRFRALHPGDFAGWWAVETQAELFGPDAVEGYDDLGDLGPIRERASTHGSRLDRLEEEFVLRYARA